MRFAKKILVSVVCSTVPFAQAELAIMDDGALSKISGEGIGATFEDVALHSSDHDDSDSLKIRLTLDNKETVGITADDDYLEISELRLHRSSTDSDPVTSGSPDSGGRFGTYDDPFYVGDLKDITESYSSTHNDGINGVVSAPRSFVALYTAFPAANKQQLTLGMQDFSVGTANYGIAGNSYGDSGYGSYGPTTYDNIYPVGFFSQSDGVGDSINVGNFYTAVATGYENSISGFEAELDQATDKFDLHLRIDSVNDLNRNSSSDEQFLASVDVNGFRLYGTDTTLWVHDAKEEVNAPTRGLAFSANLGLRAEEIKINADTNAALSSQLSLNGVDVFIPLGSVDQPLTISTVQTQQIKRGTWANPVYEPTSTQLRLEIAALPQDAVQVQKKGNIFVQSMTFGDGNDDRLWVGHQDMALRDEFGTVRQVNSDVDMYAFVPRTVIYNQQITEYNQLNVANPLPYIPNENLIEIKGLEIQRLVVTTQDL